MGSKRQSINCLVHFYKRNRHHAMFVVSPLSGRKYCCTSTSPQELVSLLTTKEGPALASISWRFLQDTHLLPANCSTFPSATSTVFLLPPGPGLPGGKGGFGSLLRSIGAQIEKTTNHEAMRDLSGRRQRDINNESRLKKYVAGQADREREAAEKKEIKLEKLRRLAEGENKDKHSFCDPLYDKARSEVEEKVHDAVEAAMNSSGSGESFKALDNPENVAGSSLKRKSADGDSGPSMKKSVRGQLWIGEGLEDLNDSDLSDSSDDSGEEGGGREKSVVAKV